VPRTRHLLAGLLLLGLVALTVPVAALANGGGSAGDQQYVDPVNRKTSSSSSTTPSSTGSSNSGNSGSSGSSGSSNATPSSGSSTSSSPPPTSSSTLTATPATTSAATTPVATTATTTTTGRTSKQLPYTGYDDRIAAGLGALLVLGGFALRRRTRRSS
jgi:LPXTG-motif cell wall-anchored protein